MCAALFVDICRDILSENDLLRCCWSSSNIPRQISEKSDSIKICKSRALKGKICEVNIARTSQLHFEKSCLLEICRQDIVFLFMVIGKFIQSIHSIID